MTAIKSIKHILDVLWNWNGVGMQLESAGMDWKYGGTPFEFSMEMRWIYTHMVGAPYTVLPRWSSVEVAFHVYAEGDDYRT